MLAIARQSAVVLLGALLLAPTLHALPGGAGEEEDNCIHLLGYGGPSAAGPTKRPLAGRAKVIGRTKNGGTLAAGVCAVDNARLNRATPTKTNADFVPLTGDDALGFYCVYGVRASATGGVGGNVGIFLFELDAGEVLLYGSGYGNIAGANLFDAAYDMERVDQVLRFCMGKSPAATPIRILVPHGHGDHVNPACNRELERLGYRIAEIAFHQDDAALVNGMAWTAADRALFRVIPAATSCLQELTSYASPLGKLWVFERAGHTAGSIDLVIDIQGDASNRFVVRGSQPSSPCAPLPGQREVVNAHGNVELLSVPPKVDDVTPLAGSSLGGTLLSLTGLDFLAAGAGTPKVLVNGVPAVGVTVVDDMTLTCATPPGPPGQLVEVEVVTNNGKALFAGAFFYNALPTLTSLTPNNGNWRGGTTTQVRGSGFLLTSGVNEVFFGAKRATNLTVLSDTLLTCRAPSGTPNTVVPVVVRNPNGEATLANAYRYNADLAITAATPDHASALGGTSVVLTGTSFTGNGATPTVTVGGTPATPVSLLSDTSVSFTVPAGTAGATVNVVLTNSAGSATFAGFRYHATPLMAALAPTHGNPAGGTRVTLSGSGFLVDGAGANLVRFGGALATQVEVLADGSLTCLAPPGTLGTTVNVTLSNENGTNSLPLAYTYSQPFGLTALAPVSGAADGGTLVTLTGSGFVDGPAGANTVNFGSLPASEVSAVDDSTLTCRAPAGAPLAVVDVSVSNANGTTTLPAAYRYHARPTLAALAPNHGHAGSTTLVTLSGSGFLTDLASPPLVVVGGVTATDVQVLGDAQLTCQFPGGVPGSTADVLLVTDNGTVTLAGAFRYHTLPSIVAASPASGAASSQPRVTLTGTGLLNDQAGTPVILFGGVPATSVSVASDQIVRCNAPAGPAGARVDLVLTNARGSATLVQGYRYHARPTVLTTGPSRGPAQGGTRVTLTGTGFQIDSAGTNLVAFGGTLATAVTVQSDTQLTCTTPAGPLNAVVDVTVTNNNGTGTLVGGYTFAVPPPVVTAVVPASGPAHAPGSIQIAGSGFLAENAGVNSVLFGSSPSGPVSVLDDATLTCQAPPGLPGTRVGVTVSNANGAGQLALAFRYHALPTLGALEPPGGSPLGGQTVILTGSGFLTDAPGTNTVTFGGTPATSVLAQSDTVLTCVAPAGLPGSVVEVVVTNANGSTGAASYAYHAAPVLAGVSPNFGAASGATLVTLSGSGFLAGAPGSTVVVIGGRNADSLVVVDDSTVTCSTPRGDPGYVDIVLTNTNGSAVLPNGFHFGRLPPEITAIEPASGPSRGQNVVTVRGRGFLEGNVGANRVKFGDQFAANVITLDDTTVLCTPPAGSAGALVDVGLNNRGGTATRSQGYRYHRIPTLTAVTPPEGPGLLQTRVTLTGSGFLDDGAGEPTVLFDNVRARDARVLDDQRIVCTAVGGAPGTVVDVSVRNVNGSAALIDAFRVLGGPPGIRTLTPAAGPYVGGTRVELEGTGFKAGGLRLNFGSGAATDVVVVDDTHLTCTTPPGVLGASVTVTLTTKDGSAALLGGYSYGPILPRLLGLGPNHGPASGGTAITLTGTGFRAEGAGTTQVLFGDVPASQVSVIDDAHVTCLAPPGSSGASVDVEISNAFGATELPSAYRYHQEPEILALTPPSGHSAGGTPVTLTGAGFRTDGAGTNLVTFGGVAAPDVVVVSDELLACSTPPGTPGSTVDVRVANANGSALFGAGFRYFVRPQLDHLTPTSGPQAGGTLLTLTGLGFLQDSPGPNVITIGGQPALEVVTVSDTVLTCLTPSRAQSGAVDVQVANANGTSLLAGAFTYYLPPELTDVTPASGPATGGTSVTLTGRGFLDVAPGTNLVLFGGVAAADVFELSDAQLTCTTPAGTPGATVDVTLVNGNGIATLVGAFQYRGAPVLVSLTPDHGPARGADVTLTGSGFLNDGAGVNTVRFGTTPATLVVVVSDTTLTCRAPAGAAGSSVDVTLTNANGTTALVAAYRIHAEPTLTGVAPGRGPAAGGTLVTLTGSGFLADEPGMTAVLFGGLGATDVVVLSDRTLTCRSPGAAPNTQVDVRVFNTNGADVLDGAFRYNPLPQLAAVAPEHGSAAGGTLVTLTGAAFGMNNPGPNTVLFGGIPATSITLLNDSQLTCLAPSGPPGATVDVSLSNENGSTTLAAAWHYDVPPTLATITPASGPALGGTPVLLGGAGFADPNAGEPLVTFNGLAAGAVSVLDDATVSCLAPPGLQSAVVDVVLANANGAVTLAAAYRYHALPTLGAILPARGSSAASSALTLIGSGFLVDGAGPNAVLFGSEPATAVTVLDDATLTCEVAPQPPGTVVDVSLANANGSVLLPGAFAFDAPAPALTGVAPTSGPSNGGTLVTLTGSGFQDFSAGLNTVTFGGAPATGVTVIDDATVTCTTPPGTAGTTIDVGLANVNGSALLAGAFTYVAPRPTLTGVAAASGKSVGGNTVTLTGTGFQANGAGPNTVLFGATPASGVTTLGDTQITCTVPAGISGTSVTVSLQNANGSAALVDGYRYHAQPVLTSISPANGTSLGGTLVTVRGSGFVVDSAGTNTVLFGSTPASSVVVLDDGRLTCRAPSGPAGTLVTVSLSNQNGSAQLANAYRYHARPTLTSVTPASGPSTGLNRVTLSGTGFLADGAVVNIVAFGGVTAGGVTVVNDQTIQCNVPAGTSGLAVQVSVANVNGTALLANGYRYHARPTLTQLTPTSGPAAGGASVTLTGSGFLNDTPGTNSVTFGGVPATGVSALNDATLTCLAPAGSAGTSVDVAVSNANGTATLFAAYSYTAAMAPALAGLVPSKGTTQGGTQLTLNGTGFVPGITVTLGNEPATDVTVIDGNTLTCRTPASSVEVWVDVTVAADGQSATLPLAFQYLAPPVLVALEPAVGLPQGGESIVLSGSGFHPDAGTPQVRFGGRDALGVTVLDGEHLAVVVPEGAPLEETDVEVTNEIGSALLTRGFRWQFRLPTDLDLDGRGDLLVGSPGDDAASTNAGAVHVFFGAALPLADRTSALADLSAVPEAAGTSFGSPVLSGDLDGDGKMELLIGAPSDDRLARDAGAVFVFSGPLGSSATPLRLADATQELTSTRLGDRFGRALVLEDFDRDGRFDLAVGAPGRSPGTVFVYMADASGLPTTASFALDGDGTNEGFAGSLAAGDLDGDGWSELIVGAQNALGDPAQSPTGNPWHPGEVRIYRGGPGALVGGAQPWVVLSGREDDARFGATLAVSDFSGDGTPDLAVGAPSSTRSGNESGVVFVFRGRADLATADTSTAEAVLDAEGPGSRLGEALVAGDIDRDGRGDLLIGAPGYGGTGRAYLLLGGDPVTSRSVALAEAVLQAENATGEFGATLALVDVDGNGREDVVVTAPAYDLELGRVYVFDGLGVLGGRDAATNDGALTGRANGDRLGHTLGGDH